MPTTDKGEQPTKETEVAHGSSSVAHPDSMTADEVQRFLDSYALALRQRDEARRLADDWQTAHENVTRQLTEAKRDAQELVGFNTAACDANRKLEEQAERMEHELATLRRQSAALQERVGELEGALHGLLSMDELEMGDESVLEQDEPNHPVIKARAILRK